MKSNRQHTAQEVEQTLFSEQGLELADYFLVDGLPMHWQTGGPFDSYPMAHVIEIDELAEACRQYLRTHGAPEYASIYAAKAARDSI